MPIPCLAAPKYLHLIYDTAYETDPGSIEHLPDLRVPFQELGYKVIEYFVSPETVHAQTKHIPTDSKDHIVFLHVDMPKKVPIGTPIETVRYLESRFKHIAGFRSTYCENTVWKSVMNKLFLQHKVPHIEFIRVQTVDELTSESVLSKLKVEFKKPYFVKVDDGFNSLGLSNKCVAHSLPELLETAKEMLQSYGPILIQRFVGGREFTVAVTNQGAYWPVERIFGEGQLVSLPGGTPTEVAIDASETSRISKCQDLAYRAFKAVGGSCYGRVDMREDPETGDIFVLEVNNTCSLAPRSYFEISVEACGSSKKKVLRDILKEVDTELAAEN